VNNHEECLSLKYYENSRKHKKNIKDCPIYSRAKTVLFVSQMPKYKEKRGTQGKGAWNENCLMSIPEDARRSGVGPSLYWSQPVLVPRELGQMLLISTNLFPIYTRETQYVFMYSSARTSGIDRGRQKFRALRKSSKDDHSFYLLPWELVTEKNTLFFAVVVIGSREDHFFVADVGIGYREDHVFCCRGNWFQRRPRFLLSWELVPEKTTSFARVGMTVVPEKTRFCCRGNWFQRRPRFLLSWKLVPEKTTFFAGVGMTCSFREDMLLLSW
jgi:hypothetical protein